MAETLSIKEEPIKYDNSFDPEQIDQKNEDIIESTEIKLSLFIKKEDSSEVPCECTTHQVYGAIKCECDIKQEDGGYHYENDFHTSMEFDDNFQQNENSSVIKQEISAEDGDALINSKGITHHHHSTSSCISGENSKIEENQGGKFVLIITS